jgi:[ribosomal protein S5]-alanine N-acetyltransferase
MTTLTTARLVLREFEAADIEAVHAYASDPETTQYMSWGPNTLDDTRAFVEHCCATAAAVPRVDYEWAVTVPSGELVGGCGIGVKGGPARQGYLGYILHRDHWGRAMPLRPLQPWSPSASSSSGCTGSGATAWHRTALRRM